MGLAEIRPKLGGAVSGLFVPFCRALKLTPDALTIVGGLVSLVAAALIATGNLLYGGIVLLVSGLFDMLDGALARALARTSRLGAVLDSVTDRITEAALFLGLAVFYLIRQESLPVVLAFLGLVGSFLVSYIRARAEGASIDCRVGVFTRPERVITMSAGLIVDQVTIALWALVVLTFVTVVQRMVHVYRQAGKSTAD